MQSGTATPTPAPGAQLYEGFQRLFAGLETVESRLVATAIVVVLAAAIMAVFAPRGVQRMASMVRNYGLEREQVPDALQTYDFVVATSAVARLLQVAAGVTAVLAILAIWGYVAAVTTLIDLFGGAAPTVGRIALTVGMIGAALVATDVLEAKMERFAEESTRITRHQQGILFQTVRLSVLIAVGLSTLTIWEVDLAGLLVGAGFLGIIVGLAARQTLSSLLAGFVIMFSRPFELGDWIAIDDTEGVVTDITINNTRLRSASGDTIVLPNDQVANSMIINHTEQNRLRLSIDVGVDYETELDRVRPLALEAITQCDETLSVPSPQVLPKAFGDSAIVLECRFWIANPSARRRSLAIAAVVSAIKARFETEDVKIPFPQRELSDRPGGAIDLGDDEAVPSPQDEE